jgi:hypothetical protein
MKKTIPQSEQFKKERNEHTQEYIDWLIFCALTPLSAIAWRPVLVVEEAGVPG